MWGGSRATGARAGREVPVSRGRPRGTERRQDVGADERTRRRLVAEIDVLGRREEVRDDEPGEDVDELARHLPAEERVDERHDEQRRHADDPRQALHRELAERVAGLRCEHQREVLVGAQVQRREHDRADEDLLEVCRTLEAVREPREEVLELADAQCVEQHVLAAGEHPVERGPGDAGLGRDVVDGHLLDAPTLAAALRGIEHARLGRPHGGETLRRIPSQCQG